ncbi:GIY-YIG nuclease family protein [Fibrobacter succinogenes]|uniref:GIY-YIG nuclease family protein n=1 Tax=Fibrobacter succinogenes TaxID=833 RepID=UPI001565024A|nr:GIY-YIG nuclease family protein [Fibrobacter succinogenes]
MAKKYIYIFTNPSFPKYVKIGEAEDPQKRLATANASTWTPKAFRIYGTYQTDTNNSDKMLHDLIDTCTDKLHVSDKINGHLRKREFYEMSPEQAWNIFKKIAEITNTTKKLWKNESWTTDEILEDIDTENEEHNDVINSTKRFNFKKYGIPVGTFIKFKYDSSIQAKILSDSNVEYKGESLSLSRLAEKLMVERTGKKWKGYQGPAYFTYNGIVLKDIKGKISSKKCNSIAVESKKGTPENKKRFDFQKIGIPVGSILKFKYDESVQVKTLSNSNVEYKGKEISLSKLAKQLMSNRTGKEWKTCQGPAYFTYKGVLATDVKNKFINKREKSKAGAK